MLIRMDQLIMAASTALDVVEGALLGSSTNHGKRISVLCSAMGRHLGFSDDEISAITTCAMFHDNALTEYILSERPGVEQEINLLLHCRYGQRNIGTLPLKSDSSGFILYHHERADGKGPFGKRQGEFPLGAELIAIADMIDVEQPLQQVSLDCLPMIREKIARQTGTRFTERAAEAMLSILDEEMLLSLQDDQVHQTAAQAIPEWTVDIEETISFANLVAHIINYKSKYTLEHSSTSANIIWTMGKYYNFDHKLRAEVYLAAALHDLGKLYIPTSILEKPGKLTDEELTEIKEHAYHSHVILENISGLENICMWASNHHEKLDGSGYPLGKKADELDFISRLMACADIYEAVRSERPYHLERSHEETMAIMHEMAEKGQIDRDIVKDFDKVMADNKTLYNN